VLRAADGVTNIQIADELGPSLPTVGNWRNRYAEHGLAGFNEAPRSGRPRQIDDPPYRP
jgi:transposase